MNKNEPDVFEFPDKNLAIKFQEKIPKRFITKTGIVVKMNQKDFNEIINVFSCVKDKKAFIKFFSNIFSCYDKDGYSKECRFKYSSFIAWLDSTLKNIELFNPNGCQCERCKLEREGVNLLGKKENPLKWKKTVALLADFFDWLFENDYLESGDKGEKWALLDGHFKDRQGKIINAAHFKNAKSEVMTKGKTAQALGKVKLIGKISELEQKLPKE